MMPDGSWIRIENLKGILDFFKPEIYHPDDPRYKKLWRTLRQRCIQGVWVEQFGKWRYTPGLLGFYGTFFRFEDWNKKQKTRVVRTPSIRDLEFHRTYYYLECDGFSGWSDDDECTSDLLVFDLNLSEVDPANERHQALFQKNGRYKEYLTPRENIFRLRESDEPLDGIPLYWNDANNLLVLGSRGGGKSYLAAGDMLHHLVMDGLKYYTPGVTQSSRAVIEVSSGQSGKGAELLDKVEFAMNCLADPTYKELGVWGNPDDLDFEPCPFWKRMEGSLNKNNKENPWINKYKVKVGNRWIEKGTGSRIYHTVHSVNQREGAQKSAGGRRTKIKKEEIGLYETLIEAWNSDEGMVVDSGHKMASQEGIGTSGNMDTILPARKVFTNPKDYGCLAFKYDARYCNDPDGDYGFFLPVTMIDAKFKDENGNTDIEAAEEFYKNKYEEKAAASDPNVLIDFRMNFPMKIEDMWLSGRGTLLPVNEAENREKELLKGNLYKSIGTPIELFWDSVHPMGVNYKPITNAEPFYTWPLEPDRKSLESVFMMFISPDKLKVNGIIPNDLIFAVHDPYVSDAWDQGGSLGVTYFIVNPKYIPYGLPGNQLAASLIGKPEHGLDWYNEQLEMGMAFYGNPQHSLWYEANMGDRVRSHFLKKRKMNLLCLRPHYEQGQFLFERSVTQTGFTVGGKMGKITLLDAFRDWLLEESEQINEDGIPEIKRNIERIPCIFLLRQIKEFTLERNFDAVSAMLGISLAVGEQEHRMLNKQRMERNPLKLLSSHFRKKIYRP